MRRWADFEDAAPELASLGRERIERFGFVFVGTVRRDGGPRVNPAEAHIVQGHLCLCMLPRSLKALDLARDPRAFLHTPVLERQLGTPGEFKLRVRAVEIQDGALREAAADTVERRSGWRPAEDWRYFTVDVEGAAFHEYDEEAHVQRLHRWTAARGVETTTRTYL
jgi:pyridoxamine 5'-phosphate oxidase-like protein